MKRAITLFSFLFVALLLRSQIGVAADCDKLYSGLAPGGPASSSKNSAWADFEKVITPGVKSAIQEVNVGLLKAYPPSKTVYVGIGQSPGPYIADLRARGVSSAFNIPLSSFRYNIGEHSNFGSRSLNEAELKALHQHFAKFLPPKEAVNGKTVLIMDLTLFGNSLSSASSHIKAYYERMGANVKVVPVAFTIPNLVLNKPTAFLESTIKIPMSNGDLIMAAGNQEFDRFSEFGSFNIITSDPNKIRRNPAYDDLIDFFRP